MPHAIPFRRHPGVNPFPVVAPSRSPLWGVSLEGLSHPGRIGVIVAALLLGGCAGCQTPQQTAAMPVAYPPHPTAYPAAPMTVAPPATGSIGQPAPYGTYAASPTVSYPPATAAPALPGPTAPAAPAANNWTWAQSSQPTAPPTIQQYGNQLQANANQYTQQLNNQTQQYANQLQQQPQQWANQAQQYANQQGQQLQNTANQYTQQFNAQTQAAIQQQQQALSGQMQQATNQLQQAMPQVPQQQTANGNWWPFTSPAGMPPSRGTPAQPVKY